MRNQQQEYPHAYLAEGRNDYSQGSFALSLEEQSVTSDNFVLKFIYSLDCAGLQQYIAAGKAKVVMRVKSPAASFRKNYEFDVCTNRCAISIPKQDVAKSIKAQAFIVAAEETDSFALPEHNQTYFHGIKFSLRKGDLLGESAEFEFKLDDTELQKPISSIFTIQCNEDTTESMVPNFEGEKIVIYLSQRLYDVYFAMRKKHEFRRYLSAVIVVPALVEALTLMQVSQEDASIENRRWYRAIQSKLPKVEVTDIVEPGIPLATIANRLLGDVAYEALYSLKETIDDINRNSETIESEWRD